MAFWEHGYEATSIADLTRVMGIGAPSLYAAFGDKKALFSAVVEEYGHTYGAFLGRAFAEEPTARRGVERALREAAVAYTTPGRPHGCLVITAATNATAASADVVAELRERREANVRAVERAIEAGQGRGRAARGHRRACPRTLHRRDRPGHVAAGARRRHPRRAGGGGRTGPARLAVERGWREKRHGPRRSAGTLDPTGTAARS
ncbi:hypothetical protein GCM10020221_30740 [Streptomyces thioluteus]|uniref:HTH tetR-type domain-containing protein n=1 Tax=Streptomyces thioluteus TaxID=66431 RepID=A0ABN3WZH4_STRTU